MVREFSFPFFSRFGGNQDNPVRTFTTIDGGRGSILKHLKGFNVVHVKIPQKFCIYDNSVYYNSRSRVSCNGSKTTNRNGRCTPSFWVSRLDVYPRNLSDQGVVHTRYSNLVEILIYNLGNCTGH